MVKKPTTYGLALLFLVGCGTGSSTSAAQGDDTSSQLVTSVPAPQPTSSTQPESSTQSPQQNTTSTVAASPSTPESQVCDGDVVFEHAPVDLDAVEYLVPFGLMVDSHVTPVDHQYFQNFGEPDRNIAVYSPGAGRVVSIQHFGTPVAENREGIVDDFRLVIEHSCTVSSIFIHIDELIPRLTVHDPGVGNHASIDVALAAGELIGTFTQNVDFNLVDLDHTVDGLINPSSYEQEPWKIHVPDTFDYFTSDIRAQLEELSLRTATPRSGRFAYDIGGRLVGNWFKEGTNGYAGTDPYRYWAGHLTFAYDHLDPSMIVVSIGTFEERSGQFAVLGNGPDPAGVGIGDGIVLYDLVDWDYTVDGEHWDRRTFATGIEATPGQRVSGAIAVQLVSEHALLVEILPGIRAVDFDGFGPGASTYTR